MQRSSELNFADRLIRRLGPNSRLIDAVSGQALSAAEIRDAVLAAAEVFLTAGLQSGEPVLIGCALSPASTLAYLGAMYAGLVPILLEERALASSG